MAKSTSTYCFVLIFLIIFSLQPSSVNAGPLAYAACQTACNLGWVSCYGTAGLAAGTVTGGLGAPLAAVGCNLAQGTVTGGLATPLAAITCNLAQGACMTGCVVLLAAPTP
ncbi:3870_t:CDS:2 [Funneliformis geosporum]|uniref:3870_t:CDS:1 n=1 Tax=Funneliformis geosporum TaxID=1117311 RepID=A0A9W4T7Q0_9GLOM|nr:3870_t:CDS:2 [Funneliformis geosporum]